MDIQGNETEPEPIADQCLCYPWVNKKCNPNKFLIASSKNLQKITAYLHGHSREWNWTRTDCQPFSYATPGLIVQVLLCDFELLRVSLEEVLRLGMEKATHDTKYTQGSKQTPLPVPLERDNPVS